MDSPNINFENVLDLMNLADKNLNKNPEHPEEISEEDQDNSSNPGSPKSPRLGNLRGNLMKSFDTAKSFLTNLVDGREKDTGKKPVATVINCVVKVLADMIDTLTTHGNNIKNIFDELKNDKERRENILEELQRRYEELENKTNQEKNGLEICLREQSDKLEKVVEKKIDEVEKQCDEARQREMKGTLVVSSPNRRGMVTEAVIRRIKYEETGAIGPESELDMVLRMVYEKTGVWIPYEDVAACHRFGNNNNNSFVLKVWNRKRFSAWDALTEGMLTGKTFSPQNIFINFMLTPKRTELSKQVRQAKKDNRIKKYSVDQNGKFHIKKLGNDDRFHPVSSNKDLEELTKN